MAFSLKGRGFSLSTKIVFSVCILILIIFCVVGVLSQYMFERHLRASIQANIREVVGHEAENIHRFFNRMESVAERSAGLVKEWIISDSFAMADDDFETYYGKIEDASGEINGEIRSIIDNFPSQDVSAIFLPSYQPMTPRIRGEITNTEARFHLYAIGLDEQIFNMYYISRDSLIRIYPKDWALNVQHDFVFTEQDFYAYGTPENNPERITRWTPAYYDDVWEEWMLSVVVPIYNEDEFMGILGHDILLESMQSDLIQVSHFHTSRSFLFTNESKILVHQDEIHYPSIAAGVMGDSWDFRVDNVPILVEPITAAIAHTENAPFFQIFHVDGEEHFFATMAIGTGGLYFGLDVPSADLLAEAPRFNQNQAITSTLVLIILASVLILLLWLVVIKPIQQLNAACQSILNGNLDTQVAVKSSDEIGELGIAFNQMAAALKEDIENREDIENELRTSREKYKTLLNNLPVGVYRFTRELNGKIVTCNQAFLSMFGYETVEEFNAIGVLGIYQNPDDRKELLKALQKNDTVLNYELSLKHKNGTPLTIYINSYLVRDENGEILFVDGAALDVTMLRNTEQALRQSQQLYLSLVDHIPMCLVRKDAEGRYTFVNQQFADLIGQPVIELIGKTDFDLVPHDQAQKIRIADLEVMREAKDTQIIRPSTLKDNREYVFQSLRSPIRDEEGSIIGLQNLFWDVTEQKNMEDDLARTQKLESLGVLAGGIAHDFNNLLTAIIGNLALAKMKSNEPEKVEQYNSLAEKASFRAQKLTHQLLTFSKGGDPIKETSSIGDLIRETIEFCLRGANVACEVYIPDNLWLVNVDRGQFSQVIQNLVLNGSQAMPDGGAISVRGENLHAQSILDEVDIDRTHTHWIRIQISDQGIGVPPEVADRIFDPYFTTKDTGNGLGLSTSFSIIQKHNGLLLLEPSRSEGATFSIYLPALQTDDSPLDSESEQTSQPQESTITGGTILLMDDDEHILDVSSKVLSMLGYTPVCVSDGTEMLSVYEEYQERGEEICCVLMDLTIPGGMGGKEAIQRLRLLDESVPAIVSSGFSNDTVMSNHKEFGFNAVISKPYHIDDLTRVLSEVITSHSADPA